MNYRRPNAPRSGRGFLAEARDRFDPQRVRSDTTEVVGDIFSLAPQHRPLWVRRIPASNVLLASIPVKRPSPPTDRFAVWLEHWAQH
jgi:hypothetical protein